MKPLTDYPFSGELFSSRKYFWNRRTAKELAEPTNGEEDHQALLAITQRSKNLFRMVSTFVPSIDGWTSVSKACTLTGLVLAMKPNVCCEIGVFGGRALISMALALQELGSGKAIGIDPYSAQASVEGEVGQNLTWWNNQEMHDEVLRKFLGYVANFKLDSVIHLIRKKSDDVDVPSDMDIFSLDGNHTEQCVRDVQRFAPKVRLGGVIVCDDIHWGQGAPLRAIDMLEEEFGFRECFRVTKPTNGEPNDWNLMQKVK